MTTPGPTLRTLVAVLASVAAIAAPVVAVAQPPTGSTLAGKVIDYLTLKGLGGVSVYVHDATGELLPEADTLTQPDGTYAIDQLPVGQNLRVRFELEGYDDYPTWESCRLPERAELNVELLPVNPETEDAERFFRILMRRSDDEQNRAWRRLAAFDLEPNTRSLLHTQALAVLGEDRVRELATSTSGSYQPDAILVYDDGGSLDDTDREHLVPAGGGDWMYEEQFEVQAEDAAEDSDDG